MDNRAMVDLSDFMVVGFYWLKRYRMQC